MPNIHAAAAQRARDFRAVVGVAALPGSNPALLDFAANLSPATGLAFLLAPQADLPGEALRQASRIPVRSIQDGMAIEPGRLHVTPPGAGVAIANRVLQLTPPAPQAPVDSFMRSLARDQQSRMVAVLLGHNASAGLLGLQTVRAQGGLCFTNDAEVAGGTADKALSPADIARGLGGIEGRLRREGVSLRAAHFQELSNLLSPAGLALGGYRSAWVQQRVDRRLALLGVAGLAEYFELMGRNPEELKALVRDIVNRHTGFFQNTEIFEALNHAILPEILKRAPAGAALRVWAPACGTGESAYSVGICVLEALGERASEVPVKIFATDADEAGLRQARAGIYPEGIALDVAPERLSRFFERMERGYVVSRQLRDLCLFARQDPLTDAPLAGLDLIWAGAAPARWSASSRMRAATNFHYGLKPEGCLVLANAGALDPFPELFAPAAGTRGVLRKRTLPQAPRISPFWMESDERELRREVIRLLGDKYGVAGAVMDQNLNVLQLWGRPGPYLRLRRGPLGSTLNRAAFPAIHSAVAQAIRRAARHSSVQRARCQIRRAAGSRMVTIHATPLQTRSGAEPCFLVLVEKGHRRVGLSTAQETRNREILRLRLELAESRAHLESIIEEQESTNEELQAANDALVCSNQELSGTNEELEMARREMVAANDELRARNSELVLLTSDLTNVFSSAELALLILDRDLRIRRYTPMAAQLFHLIPADVGRPIGQLQPEIDVTDLERLVQEVMDTGAARHREVADRAGRWYSLRVRPYRTAGNQIDGAVLAYIDITALKQSQQALWESEHRYRVVSELTSDFAYAVRVEGDGRLIREWATEALTRITGYTPPQIDAIGWEAVVHPDDRPAWREYWQRVLTSHTGALEYRILSRSGGQRWLRDQARVEGGEAVRVIGAAQDITESKRAEEALHQSEERLRQSQKMEAIGRLAGGVAHDFNNLLTAVQGYSELLLEELAGQEALRQGVEEIHKAAQRATALTGQLLAFSRRQVLQPKVLDLNALVGDLDKMLRRLIGEHIELHTVTGRDLGRVQADRSQLEQVVVNLVVNGCDAMPSGGRLTIETANVTGDPGGSSAGDEARPGPFVMLSVADTGSGMDAETRSRLFEPFFTTKPKGQGTGLGLCTVYGIVRQSGGFIDVESEPGRGATFRIYLPRAEAPAPAPEPVEVVAKPARGSETVLLVEDDAPVRTLARSILKRNGYRLLEARHGRDALRLAAQHHHPIHLLLTDVVMPGMGGPQLAEKLSRQRPGMKVLFMSGYTSGILGRDMVLDPDTAFLQKPFSGEALARRVRHTLDAA